MPNQAAAPPIIRKKKNNTWWIWLVIPLGSLLLLMLVVNVATTTTTAPRVKPSTGEREAYQVTIELVRKGLKSPSTAKFSEWRSSETRWDLIGTNHWDFEGWVDSQNGFGAMIRTEWRAQIALAFGDYQLTYLKLGDETSGQLQKSPEQIKADEDEWKRSQALKAEKIKLRADELAFVQSNTLYFKEERESATRQRILSFRLEQATNNSPSAQYELSKLYLGAGDESNRVLGLYWLNKAASSGHRDAKLLSDVIRTNGSIVLKD